MDLSKFTKEGKFLMLALDHRGSFKKLIDPQQPEAVTKTQIIKLKKEIINALDNQFSGLLIDELGLQAYGNMAKPFLLPLEKSGEKVVQLEYSARQIKDLGASGAKLLIKFDPDDQNAPSQTQTAKKALQDCRDNNLPLFLEIVTQKVIDSVKMFQEAGVVPDVWKLGYPGSLEQCQEVTQLVGDVPWILLTGGDDFETFKNKLEEASKMGAKGFLAGRALWQEVTALQDEQKEEFLNKTLPDRFKILKDVVA